MTKGDGHYDVLEVETRGLKGPRVYDASGMPLHQDNETVIKERIYLDKADANVLHDDITDDGSRPDPSVDRDHGATARDPQPVWIE